MTSSNYRTAFANFLAAQKEAVQFSNSNFTNSAVTRERFKRLEAARQTLRSAAVDEATLASGIDPEAAIADAFEGISTRDADSVAVASNEWSKVRSMLDSGRELGQIIDSSDRRRLSAVLDHIDELGAESGDAVGVAAEVQARLLDRLASLGDDKAIAAVEAQVDARHHAAWAGVIEEALTGRVSVDTRTALFNAAPEDFRATIGQDDPDWPNVENTVAHLDGLAPTLATEAS
jgi:hypothetical protein